MNLTKLLELTAKRYPQKPAVVEESTVVTYGELATLVGEFARQIQSLHIDNGSRVGLAFPNGIAYVALTFALWRLDLVVVPVPTECPEEEIEEIAVAMQLTGILTPKPRTNSVDVAPDCHFTKLNPVTPPDNHGLNLAFIRFTSGTTSARKGVALSHETIRDRVLSANKAFRITADDTVVWCLPMAHHFLITIVLYIEVGATIVLARHVTAKPFLEAVNCWKGTVLYAAPFHYSMWARDNSGVQIPSVRLAVSTTCALSQDVANDFFKRFNLPLVQGLGVIELGLVALNTAAPREKWNSVGRVAPAFSLSSPKGGEGRGEEAQLSQDKIPSPQPSPRLGGERESESLPKCADFQLRIVNPDAEGCGELAVHGPGIFDAYVAPWVPREEVLREGWFFTGDIGRLDTEGFLYLLSRKTAVINLAGRKVFPEEIETVLNRHPSVGESRVYGKLHPHLGETVEAEVVLSSPDAKLDTIHAFCREHLASYKIPTRFTIVAALPRTPVTGKIRRAAPVA